MVSPAGARQLNVYVRSAVSASVDLVPLPEDAKTVVPYLILQEEGAAFEADQVMVADCPETMLAGVAVMDTDVTEDGTEETGTMTVVAR